MIRVLFLTLLGGVLGMLLRGAFALLGLRRMRTPEPPRNSVRDTNAIEVEYEVIQDK